MGGDRYTCDQYGHWMIQSEGTCDCY
jgi:hypothetical protein